MSKESDFKELIDRLKVLGYIEQFYCYFYTTKRNSTIPEMLRKRLGLADGRIWTYDQIAQSTGRLNSFPKFGKVAGSPLSRERVRQCIHKGYRIIKTYEALNDRPKKD